MLIKRFDSEENVLNKVWLFILACEADPTERVEKEREEEDVGCAGVSEGLETDGDAATKDEGGVDTGEADQQAVETLARLGAE